MNLTQHDPPGYRARPLHYALLISELLTRIHPLALTPVLLALALLAGWPWRNSLELGLAAACMTLAHIIADGISLALLPRLGRSFGSPTPPRLALAIVRAGLTATAGILWATPAGLALVTGAQLAILGVSIYATWIEPFRIGVTRAELQSPKLSGRAPLRLLHITDLHVERISPRDRQVVHIAHELAPDAVLLTGDYLNLSSVYDADAHAEARELLSRLCEQVHNRPK